MVPQIVSAFALEVELLKLPDPLLQFHALREQLLSKFASLLELLLLAVQEVLEELAHVAFGIPDRKVISDAGGGDGVAAVREGGHRRR